MMVLFWLFCCLLSWYGSSLLIQASWDAFMQNAINFAVETTYLSWATQFPAIAICEQRSNKFIKEVRERRKLLPGETRDGENHLYVIDEVYSELVFWDTEFGFLSNNCFQNGTLKLVNNNVSFCPENNFLEISKMFLSPCQDLFAECKWKNKPFNCCDYFLPLQTEVGQCFIFNSIHTQPVEKPLDTTLNKHNGLGHIYAEVLSPVKVFIIARQEIPYENVLAELTKRLKIGDMDSRIVSVKEVENDPAVTDTTVGQRGCRLRGEGLWAFGQYSLNGCLSQCRAEAERQVCGCIAHIIPNIKPEEACNLTGIQCLLNNRKKIWMVRQEDSTGEYLTCPHCPLNCDDQEIRVIQDRKTKASLPNNRSAIDVQVHRLPTMRFKRNVVRGKLDLVVSMGGTCGLLVGASILSFVELLYFFTLRARCCSQRSWTPSAPPALPKAPERTTTTPAPDRAVAISRQNVLLPAAHAPRGPYVEHM